jgi:hypothetical protein
LQAFESILSFLIQRNNLLSEDNDASTTGLVTTRNDCGTIRDSFNLDGHTRKLKAGFRSREDRRRDKGAE